MTKINGSTNGERREIADSRLLLPLNFCHLLYSTLV